MKGIAFAIADFTDNQVVVKVKGADRADNDLFGMNAESFLKLSAKDAHIKITDFIHLPHTPQVIVEKTTKCELKQTLFDIKSISQSSM